MFYSIDGMWFINVFENDSMFGLVDTNVKVCQFGQFGWGSNKHKEFHKHWQTIITADNYFSKPF